MKPPSWLKVKAVSPEKWAYVEKVLKKGELHTICESAKCPNLGECFAKKTATFLILGNSCTRHCRFCAVPDGLPEAVDADEPRRLAEAVRELGLAYVVITSVTRDDLPDGGAAHFCKCIRKVREINPGASVEVLIPDLQGDFTALKSIVRGEPEVLNHNLETVERLYPLVRPGADYKRSLKLLKETKELNPKIYTKSGLMLGLGEKKQEVITVMQDLCSVGCDILTLGQYLSPSPVHLPVARYAEPQEYEWFKNRGLEMGFKFVAAGPLVRSSYCAGDALKDMKGR